MRWTLVSILSLTFLATSAARITPSEAEGPGMLHVRFAGMQVADPPALLDDTFSVEELKEAQPLPPPPEPVRSVWDDLADCESGEWDRNRVPGRGTARWDLAPYSVSHASHFQGGLQFHPKTWAWVAPMVLEAPPAGAHLASREQQIAVAERLLGLQGWGAWPVCARKLGLL